MWKEIANAISETKGITFEILKANPIAGGCINEAYHIKNNNQSYFVKLNHKNRIDMLAAEADGLRGLHRRGLTRTCSSTPGREQAVSRAVSPHVKRPSDHRRNSDPNLL